ncbi:MAG: hypothetical protein ACPKPY_11390 [Nitrososphaeraceae archaeon]
MARKDWTYINIPVEQSEVLDYIIDMDGKKYGITDRNQLVRTLVSDFIEKYEDYKDVRIARKAVMGIDGKEKMQPI